MQRLQMPFGLGVSVNWRHVGKVAFEANSDDIALSRWRHRTQLNSHVKAQDYFDLARPTRCSTWSTCARV